MSASDPITSAMQSAVETGVFPGAVLLVKVRGRLAYERAVGWAALVPEREPASQDTVYDLASLTKPLATATAILSLVQEGRLGLEEPLQDLLAELKGTPLGSATSSDLLSHRSGLPAWRPFYERIAERDRRQPGFLGSAASKQAALDLIRQEALVAPVGARSLYSDLGFMLLGLLVERITGCSLAAFCRDRVYARIGAGPLFFIEANGRPAGAPPGQTVDLGRVAPTEEDGWRGGVVRARVHDENAYAIGGIAGHAGLFGTASAVSAVSDAWLRSYLGQEALLPAELVRRFVSRQNRPAGSSWGLGWDTPSLPSSSGTRLSARAFGHLGYTGTSLWIDPQCELEVVLLSNRVHPTRRNEAIKQFRPVIHDLIYEELVGGKR